MSERFKMNIDPVGFEAKPTGGLAGSVQGRLGAKENIKEVTVKELAEALSSGHSVRGGLCSGKTASSFINQRVFMFDFDNEDRDIQRGIKSKVPGGGYVTLEGLLERAEKYGVPVAFAHHTYSHMKEEKGNVDRIRLVFVMDKVIEDKRERYLIYNSFREIFPEADTSCKDLGRFFFGTCHNYVEGSMDKRFVNTQDLVMSVYTLIKEISRANKITEKVEAFCSVVHVNMVNGMPDVRPKMDLKDLSFKKGENTASSIIYNIEPAVISRKMQIAFTVEEADWENGLTVKSRGVNAGTERGTKSTVSKNKEDKVVDRTTDFGMVQEKCQLLNEFMSGERWCYHEEIKGMAISMTKIEGGAEKMVKAIEDNKHLYKDQYNKTNTIEKMNGYNYTNQSCENFCPYFNSCPNRKGYDMFSVLDTKDCISTQEAPTVPLEEVEEANSKCISDFFNKPLDGDIDILKAYVGTGKTTALINFLSNNRHFCEKTLIAVDTHKLANEYAQTLDSLGIDYVHIVQPIFFTSYTKEKVEELQQRGLYGEAIKLIEEARESLQEKFNEGLLNNDTRAKESLKSLNKYLEGMEEISTTDKLILTTHARLMHLKKTHAIRMIIDEDITSSIVKEIVITKQIEAELALMIRFADSNNFSTTKSFLTSLQDFIDKVKENPCQVVDNPFTLTALGSVEKKNLRTIIKSVAPSFNIFELLKTMAGMNNRSDSSTKDSVTLYYKQGLPANVNILIMSATVNENIMESLNGGRKVTTIDSGLPVHQGKIIHHFSNFYNSRSSLKIDAKFQKIIKRIKEESPSIENIISFVQLDAKLEKEGFNPIAHFGACNGIDKFGGQDLIVLGTPHMNPANYALLAHACGSKGVMSNPEKVLTERNGFEFNFPIINAEDTSKEGELLREIQSYKIESELIQATGRARALRNDCTVHIYNNYPIKGSTLY